jgi:hypothetical protein
MACIASTFTGSVAALKASKVQVRRATRARANSARFPAETQRVLRKLGTRRRERRATRRRDARA